MTAALAVLATATAIGMVPTIASVREPALAVPRASCLAYIEPVMKKLQMDLANAGKR